MDIESLKKFLSSVRHYAPLIEVSDCEVWCISPDEGYVYYISEGGYYSLYLPEDYYNDGDYTICNVDTETGTWSTMIFDNKKEMTYNDFYEKYEKWV